MNVLCVWMYTFALWLLSPAEYGAGAPVLFPHLVAYLSVPLPAQHLDALSLGASALLSENFAQVMSTLDI